MKPMKLLFSLLLALMTLSSQASEHLCLGECASQLQARGGDITDHSCCDQTPAMDENTSNQDCDSNHCVHALNTTTEFYAKASTGSDTIISFSVLSQIRELGTWLAVSSQGPPDSSVLGDATLGLYITLKRLRFC